MIKTFLYLAIVTLAVFAGTCAAQGISTQNGLSTVTYETPDGRIRLNYPQSLLAGDRFTGTVVAEPAGDTAEEKAAFSNRISGYVVELNGSVETSTQEGRFQWVFPEALTALAIVLRREDGTIVSQVDAPVLPDILPVGPDSDSFDLPTIGQLGHPVRITGPFDGDSDSTSLVIGELPASALAESPREAFFEAPSDQVGVQPISLTENGETTSGDYRVIGFAHELPKTSLTRGEQTTLITTVHGLAGLDSPIRLQLVNHTPDIVRMPKGESEVIPVTPEAVGPDGTFTFSRDITGQQEGDFELSLTLLNEDEKDPCEKLGDAIDSAVERARNKELESDALEDEAIELEDFADKIEENPPSRWKELADYFSKPRENETEAEKASREDTTAGLARLVKKLEEINCGETMRERRRAAKRLRQEADDLVKKRDRLRAEAEKLREEADELREQHRKCLEEN